MVVKLCGVGWVSGEESRHPELLVEEISRRRINLS